MKTNIENGIPAMFMGTGGLVEESWEGFYWFNTPIRIRNGKEDVLLSKDDLIFFDF